MLGVMVIVGRSFRDGKGAVPVTEIRDRLALPTRILSNILFTLVSAGMLNEIRREGSEYDMRYSPAIDISSLRVYDILEAVDNQGFGRDNIDLKGDDLDVCATTIDDLKEITRSSEQNIKLIDLIDNNFDIEKIVNYDEDKIIELLNNKNIIRNKLKIRTSITNAKIFKSIVLEYIKDNCAFLLKK